MGPLSYTAWLSTLLALLIPPPVARSAAPLAYHLAWHYGTGREWLDVVAAQWPGRPPAAVACARGQIVVLSATGHLDQSYECDQEIQKIQLLPQSAVTRRLIGWRIPGVAIYGYDSAGRDLAPWVLSLEPIDSVCVMPVGPLIAVGYDRDSGIEVIDAQAHPQWVDRQITQCLHISAIHLTRLTPGIAVTDGSGIIHLLEATGKSWGALTSQVLNGRYLNVWGVPAADGDDLLVLNYENNFAPTLSATLFSLDGARRWSVPIGTGIPPVGQQLGAISQDGQIYVYDGAGHIVGLTHQGEFLFRIDVDPTISGLCAFRQSDGGEELVISSSHGIDAFTPKPPATTHGHASHPKR